MVSSSRIRGLARQSDGASDSGIRLILAKYLGSDHPCSILRKVAGNVYPLPGRGGPNPRFCVLSDFGEIFLF